MMQTVAWPNPHFVIMPHNPVMDDVRYPEDEVTGLPMQVCHLKHLKWDDTRLKEYGMYFRVMCGGFLVSMQ